MKSTPYMRALRPQARLCAWCAALLLLCATNAHAQFAFIEGLIQRFSDFNVNVIYGSLTPRMPALTAGNPGTRPKNWGLHGIGVEFAFAVGELTREVKPAGGAATDSVPAEETFAILDVALGYSQLWGLAATDETYEFTGSIRELPNVTMYVSFFPWSSLTPYLGVRTGLVQLHQASFYDDAEDTINRRQYPVSAQTFQVAGVGGVITGVLGFAAFAEVAYSQRYFAGLVYHSADNLVPARFPRELNVSGVQFALGLQVQVPR